MELLTDQGLRVDGRRPSELREIKVQIGVDEVSEGSAYLEHGQTKVLVRVSGPKEVSSHMRSKTLNDCAFLNCYFVNTTIGADEKISWSNSDRKTIETRLNLVQILKETVKVELFPRSQIDFYVELLEEDGDCFAVCLNACTLALIDAGIPITEYAVGCTASLARGSVPMVDINNLEESLGGPVLSLAIFPKSGHVLFAEMSQRFHLNHYNAVLEAAIEGCLYIYRILDQEVRRHLLHTGAAVFNKSSR